jgi:hypothetical protein
MVRPVADPAKPGGTIEVNGCRSETVLPGRLPTAMISVKIANLRVAVSAGRG